MKSAVRQACILIATVFSAACSAASVQEKRAVSEFVERMYSYSVNMFELGRFNGKYSPAKMCALMDEMFLENLLVRVSKTQGCEIVRPVLIRYPGASSEDLSDNADIGKMPKPKLGMPMIEADKASISATSEYGRTIFFLIKTEKGWRVENALYYESIPTEANVCHGEFLKDPTPAQLKYLPACKDY